jgi:hypothetical protein
MSQSKYKYECEVHDIYVNLKIENDTQLEVCIFMYIIYDLCTNPLVIMYMYINICIHIHVY